MTQKYQTFEKLELARFSKGSITKIWVHLTEDGIGRPILVPILIARGSKDGPVLGLSAAIHGNELNGIKVIHKLFTEIEASKLRGTIIAVPFVNIPSVLANRRKFTNEIDLNRIMPGQSSGDESEIYASRLLEKIFQPMEFLIDLHTASFGRINSYYIRVSPEYKESLKMARLQNAQIILHSKRADGTLRGAVTDLGINAITVEVGDPNTFQKGMVRSGLTGIYNLMSYLDMVDDPIEDVNDKTVVCKSSHWIYSDQGGILEVFPKLTEIVKQGQKIARVSNAFGEVIKEYYAPQKGIVIGRSTLPIGQTGSRILHLGKIKKEE